MIDVDDLSQIEKLDSEDVLGAVEAFADQCRDGWMIGRGAADLPSAEGLDGVVVLGMGGSGISGDVVKAVAGPRLPYPMEVVKDYGPLPAWVGRNTVVFAISYSGSTEETIAALSDAIDRGARVVTLSSGGPVADTAAERGLAHIRIPSGLQPRASLGYLTLPILAALGSMGVAPDAAPDVDEAVRVLSELSETCHRKRETSGNPAKDLARRIVGKVPVVYGASGIGATAAYRFKCDLNEYAKTPAFYHALPELDHNEIVGWNRLGELTSSSFVVILLRDDHDDDRIKVRFEITRRLIEDRVSDVVEIWSRGVSPLARVLSLILVTQLAAIYTGLAYGVDPGPVEVIQRLKTELAER